MDKITTKISIGYIKTYGGQFYFQDLSPARQAVTEVIIKHDIRKEKELADLLSEMIDIDDTTVRMP